MNKRWFQNNRLAVIIFLSFVFLFAVKTAYADKEVKLYFFWGKGCPHCDKEEEFLNELKEKYTQLRVESYEIRNDKENARLFSQMAEAYGIKPQGIPTIFIGSFKPVVGYRDYETTGRLIEEKVRYCIKRGCIDPIETLSKPFEKKDISHEEDEIIILPIFGEIDISEIALPVLTIILGVLDGFNPCAFFVLFTLLGILVYAMSRKKMLLIGGIFVFFSGFVYFLFMSAWLNLFLYTGQLQIITIVAGIIALIIAVINIKDFFFFKKGVSLVIPEKAKPKLFERMRNLLKTTSVTSMIIGSIVLAIAANAYEMLCTVGFPMIFTRILTLHNLPTFEYYLYLLFYNVIYVMPLTIIVLFFSITLGSKKLTEWHGQILKLISGLMMFTLGAVLLINPELFNNILVSIGLLAMVLLISAGIIFITEKVRKEKR
ncbi:MAG: hypothetical protein AB1610_08505 [Nitrospirota bacterium]